MSTISSSQWILLAGILIIIGVLMLNSFRRHRRGGGTDPRAYARDQIADLRDQRQIKDDLQQLIVELHDASRRLSAEMDTKSARLEALIRDADDRIRRLRLAGDRDQPAGGASEPAAGEPGGGLDVVIQNAAGQEPGSPDGPEPPHPLHHRILTLGRRGLSPVDIARQTGLKPGEVELILALHADAAGHPDGPVS